MLPEPGYFLIMLNKVHGFDYLRAMCSILVVAWHINLLEPLTRGNVLLVNFVNIFNYNLALLAVPIFFQVSLFLFYQNRKKPGYFCSKRIPLLLKLYLFWTLLIVVFNFLVKSTLPQLSNAISVLTFIVTGNGTYWFFFSLIFVTCLAELTARITSETFQSIRINLILFIIREGGSTY